MRIFLAGLAALALLAACGDGKPRYAAFMPRMWAHLNANLTQPGLETVRDWFDDHVPEASRK